MVLLGAQWKRVRALFNPGFAMNHLMTLVPSIVDDTMIFNKRLERAADSCELLQVDKAAALLTIDIIGHVMLDHDLNSQTTDSKFVNAFQSTISWSPAGTIVEPFKNLNPMMPIMHWYNTRLMDTYLTRVIDDRYKQRGEHVVAETERRKRGKPAIDLALDEYVAEGNSKGQNVSRGPDLAFKRFAIDQMKTFLFAGRDTTSSTIAYIYYILGLHPSSLAKVRQEYDEIFGPDIAQTPDVIKNDPLLINKLVYTTAVIKGMKTCAISQLSSETSQISKSIPFNFRVSSLNIDYLFQNADS
jgi:cytochrome P450